MKKSIFYLLLLLLVACSKEDATSPDTNTVPEGPTPSEEPVNPDREKAAENLVASVKNINPLFGACESIEQLAGHIEEIQQMEGVEDAWTDNQTLFVKIKDAGTIFYLFPADETLPEVEQGESKGELSATRMLQTTRAGETAVHLHDRARAETAVIINQQSKDEKRSEKQKRIVDPLAKDFERCCITTTVIPSQDATVDFFRTAIFDYDFVFLITHGGYNAKDGSHWLVTGEQIGNVWDVSKEIDDHNVAILHDLWLKGEDWTQISVACLKEKRDGQTRSIYYKMISEQFFQKQGKGFAADKKSVVYTSACQSQMGANTSLATAFINKGAYCFGGWTDTDYVGDETGFLFFRNLLGGCSILRAVELLPEKNKHDRTKPESSADLKIIFNKVENSATCYFHPWTDSCTDECDENTFQFLLSGRFVGLDSKTNQYGFFVSTDPTMQKFTILSGLRPDTHPSLCEYVDDGIYSEVYFWQPIGSNVLELGKTYYYCAYLYDGKHYCIDDEIMTFTAGSRGELGLFDLKGPVRSCRWNESNETREFNANGMWTTYNGKSLSQLYTDIQRDERGRIISYIEDDMITESFTYDGAGRLKEEVYAYFDDVVTNTYSYNRFGMMEWCESKVGGLDEAEDPRYIHYQVEDEDEYGNWTRRTEEYTNTGESFVITRTISYYH